jgi:phenylalanyl-tRNA synthetase beta chain
MRRSLMPGMVAAAQLNFNQGEGSLALFEQGRVFSGGDDRPVEGERLGILLSLDGSDPEAEFKRLKGVVSDVMAHIGLPAVTWRPGGAPWLHPEAGAELVTADGRVVGFAGTLSDEYADRWDLRTGVAVAELDLETANPPPLVRFASLPRYPTVVVDMTVEHRRDMVYADLEEATLGLASAWVENLSMVSRFVPPKDPAVVRTTLRLVYRHPERSLTQDEVNSAQEALRRELATRYGVAFA